MKRGARCIEGGKQQKKKGFSELDPKYRLSKREQKSKECVLKRLNAP
jgi:hypothetical protein